MKFLSSLSIRKKLLCLIFVAVLPALCIILFSGIQQRKQDIVSTKRDILHLVQSLAAQQEQLAASTRQMLKMLAQLPEVQGIDAKACNRIFRDIQEQNPVYAIINAVTPDGNMFAASKPFPPGSVNLADRKHIRDAIRTRDFSAGEYIAGRVVSVPTILYTYPVLDQNRKVIAIVSAGIKLDVYKEFMAQLKMPEGSVMSMADHKNITLYRLPEREDVPPGTPLPLQNIQGMPVDSKEGFYEAIGRDGVPRIYAYKRLWLRDKEPWYLLMYAGVDKRLALRQANIELVYNLVILGIACFFAMLLAWIAGNSIIVEPLNKLVIATQRFGKGDMHARADLPHREDELGRLAKSFDAMAVMLEMENFERKQAGEAMKLSEQKYRSLFKNAIEGIFQTSPEGQYVSVNPALARMIGYDTPEELMKGVTDLSKQGYVNPEDRVRYKKIIEEQGIIQEFETQHYKKDGSIIWISINARTVKGEAGKLLYYEGTIEDITSSKLAEEELQKTLEKLRKSLSGTIKTMSLIVETRDPYTAGHQRKVSSLAWVIAQEMGLSNDTVDTIRMAGIIHDIGKISVPAEILSKPGILTKIEMSLIKVHSQSGYDILKDAGLPYPIAEIVLQHHERLDGSGYPQGLKDGQILLESRIISVADVVEAIASYRPYRPALGIEAALEEIEKNKDILYDAEVAEACLKLFREKNFKFE